MRITRAVMMDESKIDPFIEELRAAKAAMQAAEEHYRAVQARFIDELAGQKTKTGYTTEGKVKVTVVQNQRVVIDEAGLKKSVGARLWKKISVEKLDQAKLKSAILLGEVDPQVVGKHSDITLNSPFVKMTPVQDEEEA